MSSRIITLKDRITQETTYPITSVKAIVTEDGQKFENVIEQKILEINRALDQAVGQAQVAEQAVTALTGLSNTGTAQTALSKLESDITACKSSIAAIESTLVQLTTLAKNAITTEDLTTQVTDEAGKVPTSTAVRSYITKETVDLLDYIIGTTSIEPNYIPRESGRILVNPTTNEVYISAGGDSNVWYKFSATTIQLDLSTVNSSISGQTLNLSGDLSIKDNGTIVLNNGNGDVKDDTIIL